MNNLAGPEPIAIIGMAGRFPGAADIRQFWANLRGGVDSIRFSSDEELLAAGVPGKLLADPRYVRATAVAPEIDGFDAEFFGLTPREARICDPQIRLFLELAHATLEDAGYDVDQLSDVGVFGSCGPNNYLDIVRRGERVDLQSSSGLSLKSWNYSDYLAPLVSYKLGLHGPSMGILAACSSSLVAVHLAAASLLAGECEVALAGGADIGLPLDQGYLWEQGGTLSQDGRVRPFDKSATGTLFASGGGVVALKRLSDALADHDHIRAVIRATAVNNDGSAKVGFTAPSVSGQSAVIAEAMSLADIASRDVAMIEAHATGTVLGDPIEVAALKKAYRHMGDTEVGQTALTSVKGNIGHLGHGAAVASLIKVALALENETIPANVGYREPNPALGLGGSPFQVPTQATPWPREAGRPRIAAVNTFGVGGTNAHAVVQEAPATAPVPAQPGRPRIVLWSARTAAAADRYRDNLAEHFAGPGAETFLSSVATLQRGRTAYPHRGAVVAVDAREAVALLGDPEAAGHLTSPAGSRPQNGESRIAFLFPGLGGQHPGVAQDLYDRSPAYAKAFDECLDLFEAEGVALRRAWRESDETEVTAPRVALPLIFAVEHSLARAWQSWGITPSAVVGHSLGEITAGTVAGVFSLEDAVRAVTVRSQAIQETPPGRMLAVAANRDQVAPFQTDEVRIAVVNGPLQVVLAGPDAALASVGAAMEAAGLSCRQVRTTHAFHAPIAAPAVPVFDQALRGLKLSAPAIDFYSAASGGLTGAAETTDPGFWSRQLVQPVLFADALDALTAKDGRLLMLEVGPGRSLTAVARQHPTVAEGRHQVLSTLAQRRTDPLAEVRSALAAVAGVWAAGHAVDWSAVEDLADVGRVPVPGYPYERTRHWVDVAPVPEAGEEAVDSSPFSLATWQEKQREPLADGGGNALAVTVLPQDAARAQSVTALLQDAGLRVIPLTVGAEYADNAASFVIRAGEVWDVSRVFRSLKDQGLTPDVLVHAATLGRTDTDVREQLANGFAGAAELVRQAAKASGGSAGPRPGLLILTEQSVDVSGLDPLRPGNAALAALVRTAPDEEVVSWAKLIDAGAGVAQEDLAQEIADRGEDRLVALRADRRWVPAERALTVNPGPQTPLREGGVYLITGGTGGLGAVVAKTLAGTGLNPVLILTGRKAGAGAGAEQADENRATLPADLAGLGATVEFAACDVTDQAALSALADDVSARHGAIHGVFHLAGVPGSGLLAHSSAAKAAATLGPKVFGALALAGVFADRAPLDLFVAFSSRAALDGGADAGTKNADSTTPAISASGADYAAANAVLDALVRSGVPTAGRVLTIDWPRWHDTGLTADLGGPLLLELLRSRTPRQVAVRHHVDGGPVSSAAALAAASRAGTAAAKGSAGAGGAAGGPAGAATTAGRLSAVWTSLLGRTQIAPDADFFDLGGNSLTAVELMARVRAEFGVELGIVALFDYPTLDALAAQIDRREA